ncbi:hypothetical protein GBA52_018097 [Prunus armeniaca]|nr:hypothetical protein GBA52_018097 [Prunus armeniaca]
MMPSPQDPERFSYPIKEFQWSCVLALWLRGAKVNRDGLVTLLRECKGLVMLDVRDCSGFDENND